MGPSTKSRMRGRISSTARRWSVPLPRSSGSAREPRIGNRYLGGELRIAGDELTVRLQGAAAALLVHKGEHERRDGLSGDSLPRRFGQRALDQGLDVVQPVL